MSASRVQLTVPSGVSDLYCPACAAPIFTKADGAAEQTCEHVRFVIDWEGELSLAEPESYGGADATRQQQIIDFVEQTDSWDEFLDRVVTILPASAMLLELTRAAHRGTRGEDGAEDAKAVVAVDFATPEMA